MEAMGKHKLLELELEVLDVKAKVTMKSLRGVVRAVGLALLGAAVVKELRMPAAERTWHGRLWGRVPYEFRRPTMERARQSLWAPERGMFTETVFGVGWTLNLARIVQACPLACM